MDLDFQVKVLLLAFALTVILGIIIIPILKKLKIGQQERDDGPQSHIKKQGTPTMGGIITMISIVLCAVGGFIYYKTKEPNVAKNILILLALAVGTGFVGFIDDFKKMVLKNTKGLKPAFKMLGLLIIAAGFVCYLIYVLKIDTSMIIPFVKDSVTLPIWVYIPFMVLVIVGTTNAVNLTDGIDGLASSVCAIILTALTVIATILGIKEVVVFGSILVGACLGFLVFNLNKAKVFMGDVGSLMLGGAIAGIAIYLKIPLILLIIAIIPVIEALSDIIQVLYFKKTGKRVFKMAPIHHHFELSNWKENKIVSVFCIITVIACVIGVYAI